jgi:hypothetical protein
MTTPLISVVHATRNRWDWMWRAYDWCLNRLGFDIKPDQIEYLLAFDKDDATWVKAKREVESGERIKCETRILVGPHTQGNNGAWNLATKAAKGKVILQLSDDFECPERWADKCIGRMEPYGLDKPWVLGVGDPHFSGPYSGDGKLTIIVCTSAYIRETGGFLLHPLYSSVVSDDDVTHAAPMQDRLIDAFEEIHFYHHWHGGEKDEQRDDTYVRHLSSEDHNIGWTTYQNREVACFPDIMEGDSEKDEWIAPPHKPELVEKVKNWRRERGVTNFQNKPPPEGSPMHYYMTGDLETAAVGFRQLAFKYHGFREKGYSKVCGGRFQFLPAVRRYNDCVEQLGGPKMDFWIDPREQRLKW